MADYTKAELLMMLSLLELCLDREDTRAAALEFYVKLRIMLGLSPEHNYA